MEQGFPLDTEIDEYDPMSLHFLLTTPVPSPPENSLQSLLPGQSDEAKSRTKTPKPIGTIRLTPSVGKVSRLAVDKAYRSYGFGKFLVEALDEHVRKLKGDELAEWGTIREEGDKKVVRLKLHSQVRARVRGGWTCSRQMQVVSFYKKLGYTPEGDEFDEEGGEWDGSVGWRY